MTMQNGLYIVATPIGNIKDITFRAVETLTNAQVIACEDTRITQKLLNLLNINGKKEFITIADHNEEKHIQKILQQLEAGKTVALVSDAGSPLISDPGFKLIREVRKHGFYITTIAGPCALICALQLSGLASDRFTFVGFIPTKDKAKKDFLSSFKGANFGTIICYESPNRLQKTLNVIKDVFPLSQICVAREISKLYEEIFTASVDEVITHFEQKQIKGEIVILISPQEEKPAIDIDKALTEALKTQNLKTAVNNICNLYGLKKNEVYKKALELKDEQL